MMRQQNRILKERNRIEQQKLYQEEYNSRDPEVHVDVSIVL
jgi:hypothetical protein